MVMTTAEVTRLVTSATPPRGRLDAAAGELALFARACRAGAGGDAATALRRIAPPGHGPQWEAWINGAAAADAPRAPAWVAVCAAVSALGPDTDPARLADAVAVGYEVADRIAAGLTAARRAGWCLATAAGVVGAGAGAARAARLPGQTARDALGLCATAAAGLASAEGTAGYAVQAGKAAADAVEAVLLSRAGFTSSRQPLEGRRGLFALLNAVTDGKSG